MPIIAPLLRPALLALSNGTVFRGQAIGASGFTAGEMTFHTNMLGYQEILSTPASLGQIVMITYPMVGSVGFNQQDFESDRFWAAGLVIRQWPAKASSWRKTQEFMAALEQAGMVAMAGIDTRELTHLLRDEGSLGACILAASHAAEVLDESFAIEKAKAASSQPAINVTAEVSTKTSYSWEEGTWGLSGFDKPALTKGHLCVIDLGLKRSLLRAFAQKGYKLTVLPVTASAEEVWAQKPDGLIFSDGPGDPRQASEAIGLAKSLMTKKLPIFGIGIGHQVLALASGASVKPLKTGHHGVNHPVRFVQLGYGSVSQQNQRYVVETGSLTDDMQMDQQSLFDGSVQGLVWKSHPILTTQGYVDSATAPRGTVPVFDRFLSLLG